MTDDAEKKLSEIENITVKFIKKLGEEAIQDLRQVDPETKTLFMLDVLKTLHNKDV